MFLDLDDKIIFYFDVPAPPHARDKDVRGRVKKQCLDERIKNIYKKTSTRTKSNTECGMYLFL
jgi:hypothetical protein